MPSLFGPNSLQKQAGNTLGQTAGFGTSAGEGLAGQAGSFWSSILQSPQSAMNVLSPQISGIKAQGEHSLKTLGAFGNRSGGTNAAAQGITDESNKSIDDLIATLTGQAGSQAGALGTNLLYSGTGAAQAQGALGTQEKSQLDQLLSGLGGAAGTLGGKALGNEFPNIFG